MRPADLLLALVLVTPPAALACSSGSTGSDSAAASDAGARADTSMDPSPSDAASPTPDGGAALGAAGTFDASGEIGPSGGSTSPFTFDAPVGSRVVMKQGGTTMTCGDVLLEWLGDHLTVEVFGCGTAQAIDLAFDAPLVAGTFPADASAYPRAQAQVSRTSGGNHALDQGAASYGSRFDNKGATLTVSNVVAHASTVNLDLHVSGDIAGNSSCTQCTAGGSTLTVDLTLALTNVPK